MCVANQSATQEIVTCARCDEIILSTETAKTISICGKFQEVHEKCYQKRKMGTGLDLT
jgi:alpha-acetolactate decarboxylase